MSKHTTLTCNRCRANNGLYGDNIGWCELSFDSPAAGNSLRHRLPADLCPSCTERLIEWLDGPTDRRRATP